MFPKNKTSNKDSSDGKTQNKTGRREKKKQVSETRILALVQEEARLEICWLSEMF